MFFGEEEDLRRVGSFDEDLVVFFDFDGTGLFERRTTLPDMIFCLHVLFNCTISLTKKEILEK